MKYFTLVTTTIVIALLLTPGLPASSSTLLLKNNTAISGPAPYDQKNSAAIFGVSNTLPNGSHDASFGLQNQFSCLAEGWAVDPDDVNTDLNVRILSDDVQVAQAVAGNFSQTLRLGVFVRVEHASFSINLWGLISPDMDHSITEQAQDPQTGQWVNVSNTPKSLNCVELPPPPSQPLIAANPKDDNISIYGLELGTEVTMSIDDPSTFDIDFQQVATVDYAPWAPGNPNEIIAYFDFANAFDLHPGQIITATAGDSTNTYTVTDFALTDINVATNTASGIASPFSQIQFCLGGEPCRYTIADETGKWTALPGDPVTFVLQPGQSGFVAENEDDYDKTYEVWTAHALERGSHDYQSGIAAEYSCHAGGWAMEPNNPYTDVNVRVLVDGHQVAGNIIANNFRDDLETAWNEGVSGCPDGTCGFDVNLWSQVSHNQAHVVTVQAQNLQTGEWLSLNETPKTLTCQSQDIYVYDLQTGHATQITNTDSVSEYNPSWSPNGKKIVHDVSKGDGTQSLYITDVKTKVSTPLKGTDKGNDPVWSPDELLIAFDTNFSDQQANLYVVPVTGGHRQLIRENAVGPSWSPTGLRLAFQDLGDGGKLKTVGLLGYLVIQVADFGENPAWSPDGKWIAYEQNGDIWKVRVNLLGIPLANPVQITSLAAWEDQPTWTPNSLTIVFQSFQGTDYLNGDSDIWKVPAAGGVPTRVTGVPVLGDYDPNIGTNASKIAYSSASISAHP